MGATGGGALYYFHHDGTEWVEVLHCVGGGSQLGGSIDIDGTTLVGGDPFSAGLVGVVNTYVTSDLGLDAVPDTVPFTGALDLETYGGLAGDLMGLFTLSIGGSPIVLILGVDVFDADGLNLFSATAPPSVSGLEVSFLAAGFWSPGLVGLSNVVTVSVD